MELSGFLLHLGGFLTSTRPFDSCLVVPSFYAIRSCSFLLRHWHFFLMYLAGAMTRPQLIRVRASTACFLPGTSLFLVGRFLPSAVVFSTVFRIIRPGRSCLGEEERYSLAP